MRTDSVALDYIWSALGGIEVFPPLAHPEVGVDETLDAVDVRCVAEPGEERRRLLRQSRGLFWLLAIFFLVRRHGWVLPHVRVMY